MRNLVLLFSFLFLTACSDVIDKPKNLISERKMAEIIAELSINDQANFVNPSGNLEAGTRFVLKKNEVKSEDFVASYEYYNIKKRTPKIIERAKKIVLEKNPEAEAFINKKLEGIPKPGEPMMQNQMEQPSTLPPPQEQIPLEGPSPKRKKIIPPPTLK